MRGAARLAGPLLLDAPATVEATWTGLLHGLYWLVANLADEAPRTGQAARTAFGSQSAGSARPSATVTLEFTGLAYFGALLLIGLLTSITDPERFGWR